MCCEKWLVCQYSYYILLLHTIKAMILIFECADSDIGLIKWALVLRTNLNNRSLLKPSILIVSQILLTILRRLNLIRAKYDILVRNQKLYRFHNLINKWNHIYRPKKKYIIIFLCRMRVNMETYIGDSNDLFLLSL